MPSTVNLNRREFLAAAAGAGALSVVGAPAAFGAEGAAKKTAVGLASDVWGLHDKAHAARGEPGDARDPLAFLAQCVALGAAGMQGPLGIRDAEYTTKLRRWVEERALYIEGSIDLSGERLDLERVEKQLATAKDVGAKVVRTVVIPGRRYEYFKTADQFAAASTRALETLRQVEPLCARLRLRLAVENHKDQRVPQRVELLKRLSSEWIGACVDLGNSFSLCEDPLEVVKALAPWGYSVHLKDQAVQESTDGFLFGDAALGEGFLDLAEMVKVLRAQHPEVRFSLEVITRDPLHVPVLTPAYWATMADVPATELAQTLRTVKAKAARNLPTISGLPLEQQVAAETRNITASLAYAREHLDL